MTSLNPKSIVSAVFNSIILECKEAIKTIDNPDNYLIKIYPFSIERYDGKPVPKEILETIKNALET